ncbi:MAG: flavin reductase family protein [Xanthobacteraceae bacterium]|nr:flavin reductase family protein [Xanthobacteraceae bacterium]
MSDAPARHAEVSGDAAPPDFRSVMRRLAGGVSIITAGCGQDITGMTVTSLTSLSAEPPRLLVNVNLNASSLPLIRHDRLFGVNILGSDQEEAAARFSSRLKGAQRFEGLTWFRRPSGLPLLAGSLATIECRVDEIIERYSHAVIIGELLHTSLSPDLSALAYWDGGYVPIARDHDLGRAADVGLPLRGGAAGSGKRPLLP